MKATGIVRRIDDLGRVVIPKEIRRRVTVTLDAPQTGVAHHACPLTVRVENASALPLPCVRV